jgi:hypothetical protein
LSLGAARSEAVTLSRYGLAQSGVRVSKSSDSQHDPSLGYVR